MVERVTLSHVPEELALYLAYYRNVENAAFLRQQLLAGNQEFEYAFIDASMVGHLSSLITRTEVEVGCFKKANLGRHFSRHQ